MEFFHLFSIVVVLCAAFAYLNFRFLKLPSTIGLMLISLVFSVMILLSGHVYPSVVNIVEEKLKTINFSDLLLESMLSFMLFAGAIHIKYEDLKSEKFSVMLFSTVSVVISTIAMGLVTFYLLSLFGISADIMHCFLFGSLISPTDPIAVLSILKSTGVPKSLETKIAGESLFNDGVAVVIFITILHLSQPNVDISINNILMLFAQEAIGGIVLGIIIGWIGFRMIASIDNYKVEVLITLAIVMGGYTLAHYIHVSGPLAMVAAGLITGNHGKNYGMSQITADYVDKFWELLDEILNAFLFVLIGLELLILDISNTILLVSAILIFMLLIIRYVSVFIPSLMIIFKEKLNRKSLLILTWGGLRGGISIALALSIPVDYSKEIWVTITYVIVCFSIIVQGLTIGKLAKAKE